MSVVHLPWLTLTLNDRQVLQQTHSSLCSRNSGIVSDYALFLAEVVFQDFPVELFTQRPVLIQALCGFISTIPEDAYLGGFIKYICSQNLQIFNIFQNKKIGFYYIF